MKRNKYGNMNNKYKKNKSLSKPLNKFKKEKKVKVLFKIKEKQRKRLFQKKRSKKSAFLFLILKIIFFLLIIFSLNQLNSIYNAKIERRYEYKYHLLKKYNRKYNESNLVTFDDKLNWLMIHDSTKLKSKCADKILLHKFSKFILGKDYCNKILKIYKNANEINLTELPDKFVLKTNHGSGFNIIVTNKSLINIDKAKKMLSDWMKIDYGSGGEFHYSYIKRKIFAEEFIGETLKNYKFLCYYGKPKYVYVSIKEHGNKYRNFYDMDWNLLPFVCLSKRHPTYKYEKPKFFELMKKMAAKLSKRFIFVRVDLYELENEVRLGELTFTPMAAYFHCQKLEDEITLGKDIITNKRTFSII